MPRWPFLAAAGAIATVIAGVMIVTALVEPPACGSAAAGSASIGGRLPPVDHTGKRRRSGPVSDSPLLVYFGYTYCPDICPVDVLRMSRATYALDDAGIEITPVFVTIDPERDQPELLAEFVEALHPRMIALTGSEGEIAEAAEDWRIYFRRGEGEDEFYLMDHSTITYLADTDGQYLAHFTREASVQHMVDSVACLKDAGRI